MQTFLPYPTLKDSLEALDNKRLNKQILETYQILNVLSGQSKSGAWRNHPAVLMWEGAEAELYRYGMIAVSIASGRGIKTDKNEANLKALARKCGSAWGDDDPAWRKNTTTMRKVNTTHKVNLFRKDPEYYADFAEFENSSYNTPCCDKCKYYWATHRG
jgi:hypothetical protein